MSLFWHWLVWGFLATALLTALLSSSQQLGFTRMSLPYLLGTMFTPRRDAARLVGTLVHLVDGWLFAFLYLAIFYAWNKAGWWRGAVVGAGHALLVLAVAMPLMPAFHRRMASEQEGPTTCRQLEPPGFFALHYGLQTPVWTLVAHVIFGMLLGFVAPLPR